MPSSAQTSAAPGATRSSAAPVAEELPPDTPSASVSSVQPTEIVWEYAPGPETSALPAPLLPAHATSTAPALRACSSAAARSGESAG